VRGIVDGERARQLALGADGLGVGPQPPPALRAALEGWMSFLEA